MSTLKRLTFSVDPENMKIIRSLDDFSHPDHPTAVAIGNFDGVHLGHRKILSFLDKEARANNLSSLVLTFWPHPGKITNKGHIKLIQTLEQRLEKIGRLQAQTVLILPFTKYLAGMSAQDFLSRIVVDSLKAKIIIVGENFRFGKDRKGNIKTLHSLAARYHFSIHSIPSISIQKTMVSSSKIRLHIEKGEIRKANDFLGAPFEIEGQVIKGTSRGRNLGFPTANICTENEIIPSGVFITKAMFGGNSYPSITNVGTSPTFDKKDCHIETHIINFRDNLYGNRVQIQFLDKIRNEKRFDTPENLSRQIRQDLEHAEAYFDIERQD